MGERASRVERHYDNRDYGEVPYAAPLALRAVRGSVVRRRNPVVEATDTLVARINRELGEGRHMAAPAPPEALERPVEDPPEELHVLPRRRKLAAAAIEAVTDDT